jgi:tetratricopeptide (TPR) repeat protein
MFNLRAGMDHAFDAEAADAAARYGVALRRFWNLRGMVREGQERLQRAAQKADSIADSRLRVQLLLALGALYIAGGSLDKAFRAYQELLAASEAAGDPVGTGQALQGLGTVMLSRGDLDAAEPYLERAVIAKRQAGDALGLYTTLNSLGWLAQERGDYALAQSHFTECLTLLEQRGDRATSASVWNHLGVVATARGAQDEARNAFQQACDLSVETGNVHTEAYALINLGGLAMQQNDPGEARRSYGKALKIIQPMEDKPAIAACLVGLGRAESTDTSMLSAAVSHTREGLALYRETDNRRSIAEALEALAEIALLGSRPDAARLFLAGAERLRIDTKASRTPYEAKRFAETSRGAGFDTDSLPAVGAPDLDALDRLAQTLEPA